MEVTLLLAGCLICYQYNFGDAVKMYRRQPNQRDGRYWSSMDLTNTQSQPMNTGLLSNILSNNAPIINGAPSASFSSNSRGRQLKEHNPHNPLLRPVGVQKSEIIYTPSEIAEQFPWIETTRSRRSSNAPEPPGGWTKFNNPRFLTNVLDGLTRDDYDFKVTRGAKTAGGTYKVRVEQKWREIPIYGMSFVMEQEEDTNFILESVDGEFLSEIEEDIPSETPAISESNAIARALQHNNHELSQVVEPSAKLVVDTIGDKAILCYMINYVVRTTFTVTPTPTTAPAHTSTEAPSATTTASSPTTTGPSPTAAGPWKRQATVGVGAGTGATAGVRTRTRGGAGGRPARIGAEVFKFSKAITKRTTSSRPWVVMNANTGEILRHWEGMTGLLNDIAPEAELVRVPIRTGNPNYNETIYDVIMYKDASKGTCYYKKPISSQNFLYVNDKNTSQSSCFEFQCQRALHPNYDQIDNIPSPRNSAFKWGAAVIDYLKGISSTKWDFDINIEVHHPSETSNWDGRKVNLGDGNRFFYPMTTPDVIAHEIAHAFTEHVSNLEEYGEAGAINDAYSDMASAAFVNHFFHYEPSLAFLVARMAIKGNKAMRDMCNPLSRDRYNISRDYERPLTSYIDWRPFTEVHEASALYSKAFCELSKIPNWNIQKAFLVFTRANVIYWRPKQGMDTGVCSVKKAAHDMHNTMQAARDVDEAFATVDLKCNWDTWINMVAWG